MSSAVLKSVLNVFVIVGAVLGLLGIMSPTHGVQGFGLALACAVGRAILDKLDAIHAALEAKDHPAERSPANNPPTS